MTCPVLCLLKDNIPKVEPDNIMYVLFKVNLFYIYIKSK